MDTKCIISNVDLLKHWQEHRRLTRKTVVAFPEKELFEFSIGGMRTFADMIKELLSIAEPGLNNIVSNEVEPYNHNLALHTKEELLAQWDADTDAIDELFMQITSSRFHEEFNLFGEYKSPVIQNIQYFIDNEIHHRAQGYVYLRALGIEPPFFWDRF